MVKFVLASGSPRRKELLEQIGLSFEIASDKHIAKSIALKSLAENSKSKTADILLYSSSNTLDALISQ